MVVCYRNEVTELHLGVAFSRDNEAVITKAVNRTLALLKSEIAVINLSLTPLYIALPDSFSAKVLSDTYATWKNKTVLALLVLASNSAGFMTVMAANDLGIPVLWATGEVAHGYLNRVSCFYINYVSILKVSRKHNFCGVEHRFSTYAVVIFNTLR